jgi:hypothetical protein
MDKKYSICFTDVTNLASKEQNNYVGHVQILSVIQRVKWNLYSPNLKPPLHLFYLFKSINLMWGYVGLYGNDSVARATEYRFAEAIEAWARPVYRTWLVYPSV